MIVPVISNSLLASRFYCKDDGDDVEIVITSEQEESSDPPRSADTHSIEAWYSWSSASVRACLINAGEVVQVECDNISTGQSFSFVISGNGSSVMPITSSAGYWRIKFTLASGSVYSGLFYIQNF